MGGGGQERRVREGESGGMEEVWGGGGWWCLFLGGGPLEEGLKFPHDSYRDNTAKLIHSNFNTFTVT